MTPALYENGLRGEVIGGLSATLVKGTAMEQLIRVGIVHDHQLFSDVVTAVLHQEEEITLIDDAAFDLECMMTTEHAIPLDIVLIDTTMARMNAVHVTRAIKRAAPAIQIIALGVGSGEEDVLRFIEAGASGYILKNASYAELLDTIKAVHHGLTPCTPRIAALVFARIAALARQQNQLHRLHQIHLTRREREVLQLMADGCRNGEIASQLGVALDTVKRHAANLCKKFQVHGRRAVLQRAAEHGLLRGAGRAPLLGVTDLAG
jgi:DNA-binding NarL/FixJ family response regulator